MEGFSISDVREKLNNGQSEEVIIAIVECQNLLLSEIKRLNNRMANDELLASFRGGFGL